MNENIFIDVIIYVFIIAILIWRGLVWLFKASD